MKTILHFKDSTFASLLSILIFVSCLCTEALAQINGVDASTNNMLERGTGVVFNLPGIGAPAPNGEDALARSKDYYYYSTNGATADDDIYVIEAATNALVHTEVFAPNANFQCLAYVDDAIGPGLDRLYALDIVSDSLIEFEVLPPVMYLQPTGVVFPVANADRACAGGSGRLFVQVAPPLGPARIQIIDPATGLVVNSINTPAGGSVIFDGLAFDGGNLYGSEPMFPNSTVWQVNPTAGWAALGIFPFWFAALGAVN